MNSLEKIRRLLGYKNAWQMSKELEESISKISNALNRDKIDRYQAKLISKIMTKMKEQGIDRDLLIDILKK